MSTTKTIIVFVFFAIFSITNVKGQNSPLSDEYIRLAEESKKNMKQDDAINYYEKASVEFKTLGNIEQFINAYNQIGIILTRQDKYEKAKTYLEKAFAQTNLNRFDEAVKSYEKALETGMTRGVAYYNMACVYAISKQTDKAFEMLGKAIDAGYTDRSQFETDTDLTSIRNDPRFTQILARLPKG